MFMYSVHVHALYYVHASVAIIYHQGKHVLAASNDYAARIWGVHDQKIRVSLPTILIISSLYKIH